MEKKIISAAIAVVAAVIIYFGGWEIIKFIGSNVFEFSLELSGYSASLALHHCADVLYGVSSLQNLSQTDKHQ